MRLIDADKMMDYYKKRVEEETRSSRHHGISMPEVSYGSIEFMRQLLNTQPSVEIDGARRSGYWIKTEYESEYDRSVYDAWQCSECGKVWPYTHKTRFCPNCGAKMK